MVIASAGQTASHSLQAMQRSSPLGYRRSACSPRKRGLIGVFSSGYITVILRAKRWRPVRRMPLKSSASMKLETMSLARASMALLSDPDGERERLGDGRHHHQPHHDDPHQRDGDEHLPP